CGRRSHRRDGRQALWRRRHVDLPRDRARTAGRGTGRYFRGERTIRSGLMDMTTLLSAEALAEAQALEARPLGSFLDNEGRVAVVTGAARGLGLAIARRLAESGATVLMADRLADE